MPLRQIEQLFLERSYHRGVAERTLMFQSLIHQVRLLERVQPVVGAYKVPGFLEGRGRERMLALQCEESSELGQGIDQVGGPGTAGRLCGANLVGDAFAVVARRKA